MVLTIELSSATRCCPHIAAPCRTSKRAARKVLAARSISAINARNGVTAITPARIVTVPSVRTSKRMSGSKSNKSCCFPLSTSWSPALCRRNCEQWPAVIRRRSTICSFALPLKPYCNWPRTRASSAPASAWSACSTPGPDNCSIIPTSITSSLAAASLLTAAGALHALTFWCPSRPSSDLSRQVS